MPGQELQLSFIARKVASVTGGKTSVFAEMQARAID
jgi:hypothetical protein